MENEEFISLCKRAIELLESVERKLDALTLQHASVSIPSVRIDPDPLLCTCGNTAVSNIPCPIHLTQWTTTGRSLVGDQAGSKI